MNFSEVINTDHFILSLGNPNRVHSSDRHTYVEFNWGSYSMGKNGITLAEFNLFKETLNSALYGEPGLNYCEYFSSHEAVTYHEIEYPYDVPTFKPDNYHNFLYNGIFLTVNKETYVIYKDTVFNTKDHGIYKVGVIDENPNNSLLVGLEDLRYFMGR